MVEGSRVGLVIVGFCFGIIVCFMYLGYGSSVITLIPDTLSSRDFAPSTAPKTQQMTQEPHRDIDEGLLNLSHGASNGGPSWSGHN
jgi:hypothetical protein